MAVGRVRSAGGGVVVGPAWAQGEAASNPLVDAYATEHDVHNEPID